MLSPMAWQSTIGLSFSLLGWLMTSPLLYSQTALQTQNQSTPAQRAAAAAFRVDTDIYLKVNNTKPDKQTLTLFKEGVYYDFPMDDDKQPITMTDPTRGRIVVLSPSRQIKTQLKTADLLSHLEALKKDVGTNKELAGMLSASQKVSFDQNTNVLIVGDESLAYEATLQTARDASIAQQYADFADWYARINALLPPNFPPFVRLELNRQVAARGALPIRSPAPLGITASRLRSAANCWSSPACPATTKPRFAWWEKCCNVARKSPKPNSSVRRKSPAPIPEPA